MGLASDLGDVSSRPNVFQRSMQAFGSAKVGAWTFSKTCATQQISRFRAGS